MKFLLWLSQQFDALGASWRKVLLGAIGLAALAAVVFYGPALLEGDSRQVPVRAPASVVSKPLTPPAPVGDKPPDQAPQPEPPKPIVAAAAPVPAPAPAPAPTATPAPAPEPEPEPAPAVAAKPATYQVQLGAFQDEARADRLAKRVARAGFPATVTPVDLPDRGRFYRVRLKPELSHAKAKQLLARLEKKMPKQKAILVPTSG